MCTLLIAKFKLISDFTFLKPILRFKTPILCILAHFNQTLISHKAKQRNLISFGNGYKMTFSKKKVEKGSGKESRMLQVTVVHTF